MGKIRRTLFICILLLTTTFLYACMPPSYTKADKENMKKQYEPEVIAWFADNMPDATVKKVSVYTDGTDLAYAMTGTVKYNNETADFVYNLETKTMYLPFGYNEAFEIVAAEVSEVLNVSLDRFVIKDSYFCFYTANPFPGNINIETSYVEFSGLKPYDRSSEQFAEDIISGNIYTAFHVYVYDNKIPEYDAVVFEKLPNMVSVNYSVPLIWDTADETNENFYSFRLSSASYTDLSAEYYYLGLEKSKDDIITGYVQSIKNKGEEIPVPNSAKDSTVTKGDGEIVINTPKQCIPIVFTKKKGKLNCSYRIKGRDIADELSALDKNASKDAIWGKGTAYEGCDEFFGLSAGRIILPKSDYHCYELFTYSELDTTEFTVSY